MRRSGWTPSIVPNGDDQNVYLVVDDFGRNGRAWREADVEATDLERVILDLLEGQHKNPVRVVGFNTAKAGRRMSPLTWRRSFGTAAIIKCARFRFPCRISSIVTRADITTFNCRCLSVWCEPWRSLVKNRPRSARRPPIRGSSSLRLRRLLKRCRAVSAGSMKSSSTATGFKSISGVPR